MSNTTKKPLHTGQILTVQGGRYKGVGAQVKRIHDNGKVDVLIAGKIRKLSKESLGYAD